MNFFFKFGVLNVIVNLHELAWAVSQSSGSMLDCQSLGPRFKEPRGRLVSLVVACWTAYHQVLGSKNQEGVIVSLVVACWPTNHWVLCSKSQEGGQLVQWQYAGLQITGSQVQSSRREASQSSGSMLAYKSLGPGFKVAGRRLGSPMVVFWTADHWVLGSKNQEGCQLVGLS